MGALEFVGCARRQWRETTALTVYREESSPFQLTCSPAEADIGQVRSSNLAIAAMMAYEGVQPRGRFVKMADDDVRDVAVGAVSTRDGRTLAYLEVGDPQGPLVIHNHGGPSSRFEARLLAEAASKNRLRLVCVERPGMGQSSRAEDAQLFRLGRRHGDNRQRVGIPRVRSDGLVGRWPMGTGRSRLHRPGSTAPHQQHRGRQLRNIR